VPPRGSDAGNSHMTKRIQKVIHLSKKVQVLDFSKREKMDAEGAMMETIARYLERQHSLILQYTFKSVLLYY
jgi:hypothetical protein